MSNKIVIQSHKGEYTTSFIRGGMDQLNDNLVANAVYIIDRNICKLYADRIDKVLSSPRIMKIDASEENKSLDKMPRYVHELVSLNIKRGNIRAQKMLELAPTIASYGLSTRAEVILGLPGENYEKHLSTLRKLVAARTDDILVHTCMLLPGSEMAIPEEREKWKFETKFRILPSDFAVLQNGEKV